MNHDSMIMHVRVCVLYLHIFIRRTLFYRTTELRARPLVVNMKRVCTAVRLQTLSRSIPVQYTTSTTTISKQLLSYHMSQDMSASATELLRRTSFDPQQLLFQSEWPPSAIWSAPNAPLFVPWLSSLRSHRDDGPERRVSRDVRLQVREGVLDPVRVEYARYLLRRWRGRGRG